MIRQLRQIVNQLKLKSVENVRTFKHCSKLYSVRCQEFKMTSDSFQGGHQYYSRARIDFYIQKNRKVDLFQRSCFHSSGKLLAGHSKWANIKHTKAAKDSKKSAVTDSIVKRIQGAVKETGITDPKFNLTLARLIAEAKSQDIPNSTVENALKAVASAKNKSTLVTVEARGPGNSMVIVECMTSKPTVTKNELLAIFRNCGGKIGERGSANHCFETKGFIDVDIKKDEKVDLDSYVDVAIETGAVDVTLENYEDEEKFLRFECEPNDLLIVKSKLEKKSLVILDYLVDYIPRHYVEPSDDDMIKINKMFTKLDLNGTVERIFINVAMN